MSKEKTAKARKYFMSAKGEQGSGRVSFWVEKLKKLKAQDGRIYEEMGGKQIIAKSLLGASPIEYIRSAGPMEVMFTPNDNSMHVMSYFFPFDLESLSTAFATLSKNDNAHAKAMFICKLATPIEHADGRWEMNTPIGADKPLVQTNMKGVYFEEVDLVDGKAPKYQWFDQTIQTYNPDEWTAPDEVVAIAEGENTKVAIATRRK